MSYPAETAPYPLRWRMLVILLIAGFMNLIDVTIVNVALPSLQANLGASDSEIEWVVAAYILAFAIGLLPFGRLGDRIGRKRMFILGVGGFTLFSAVCGLAPTIGWLIFARVLQGFAGAMMMPQVLAIAQVTFPPQERGAAFSLFGLSAGLASVAGPLVGGLLISANLWGLDWRPIFLVNIPVGVIAVIAAQIYVPKIAPHEKIENDLPGTLVAGASIFLLVFALIEGRGFGWPLWIFGLIAVAIAGIAGFFLLERARARAGREQLLPVVLLENRNYLLGTLMTLLFSSGIAGFFLVLAVFLQSGFAFTPLRSGLTTLPFSIGVLASSFLNRFFGSHYLRQRVAAGAVLLAAGMFALRLFIVDVGSYADHFVLLAPLFIAGTGLGLTISSLFQTVLATVPHRDAGAGSGGLQTLQQVGGALGVAIMGQIFFSVLTSGMTSGSGPQTAFRDAIEAALIYEIAAFALVAVLVFLLRPPAQAGQGHGHGRPSEGRAEPAVVEL